MRYEDLLGPDDLALEAEPRIPERRLGFSGAGLSHRQWVAAATSKLSELLAIPAPVRDPRATIVRTVVADGVRTEVIRLDTERGVSLPGYLLTREDALDPPERMVLALHGHGEVEAMLAVDGVAEDYHHRFAHHLARAGHAVLVPELRGFGALHELGAELRYWRWGSPMAYTLQSDALLYGHSMLGDTVGDLQRWENWLADTHAVTAIDVVGISWGGDLALTYPIFSGRVRSIFASGTFGSFSHVFRVAGNAPAHCLPGVLRWLDRADITGLNAPIPLAIHYGARDVPGPDNHSAAFNDSVPDSVDELRAVYAAAGGPAPELIISDHLGHEMDLAALTDWLDRQFLG